MLATRGIDSEAGFKSRERISADLYERVALAVSGSVERLEALAFLATVGESTPKSARKRKCDDV